MVEPVDVTVGMGTPVRVHVTRRPLSKVQALTESLYQAQKDARTETRAHLKRAGETFLREQADQRSLGAAQSKGRGAEAADFRVGAAARQHHHEGAQLRDSVRQSRHREPFYPPPNKTHDGSHSGKPQRSLRQGAKVAFAGDAENKAGGQAKLDIRALDDHDDLEAEVKHYRGRVEDLQGTVDQLRDELQAQRSARELEQANAEMDAVRRDLTDNASSERRLRDSSVQAAESRSALVAQLKEFEEANRSLRKMLRAMNEKQGTQKFETQREALLSQIDTMEQTNRRLREQLYKRDAENEVLGGKVMHTEELQRSFEKMKATMRENQTKLERQLKAKRRECLQKDEEIARLLQQHSNSALSMAEFRDAVSELEARASGEKAALKRAHKETKHRLRHCEAVLDQLRADLAHRESRLRSTDEQVHEVKEENEALQQRLERLSNAHEAALSELERREHRINHLEEESAQTYSELQAVRQQAEQLGPTQSRAATLESDRAELNGRVQQLVTELETKVSDLNQTKLDMHELQLQHRKLTHRLEEQTEEARRASDKVANLSTQLSELETRLRSEKDQSESARRELSSSVGTLQTTLGEERRQNEEARRRAEERIHQLEAELRRAIEVSEHADHLRKEGERRAESEVHSLREKLDYANTAKRSLENYVSYVKSTYNSVFDEPRLG